MKNSIVNFFIKNICKIVLFISLLVNIQTLSAQHKDNLLKDGWMSKIRADHPRMFINREMLPALRLKVKNDLYAEFEKLKREVEDLPFDAPVIMNTNLYKVLPDGSIKPNKVAELGHKLFKFNGGDQAVKLALVYLITEDKKYIEKAVNYIKLANYVFQWTAEKKIWVDMTGNVRINTLTAYDWVCSELTHAQRKDLLLPILNYVAEAQPSGSYKFRRTIGAYFDGNYGEKALQWFVGLAGYGDGIDDLRFKGMIENGAKLFVDMMNHRETISAGSGLLSSSTVTYSFSNYPYSTFHFFHTWRSAFNEDLTDKWQQMLDYPNWFDWAAIKLSGTGRMLFHGVGDIGHTDNQHRVDDLYTHMAQVAHFYGKKYPEKVKKAYSLQGKLPPSLRSVISGTYPFLPFLLTGFNANNVSNSSPIDYGKYFYNSSFGLLLMRSGKGEEDTYASFRFGSNQINHQHYDDLSFIIYKKNFLALDGGSRALTDHHHNFAPQSVAHNTILIHEPNEPMPPFWKNWEYIPDGKIYYNHGGQNFKDKSVAVALHSTDDFIYAAGDGTKNYSEKKAKEAVRQFVYLKPNIFVIYDRVESVKPQQRKEFLLHFQDEPRAINDKEWRADHGGSLFSTTLLPKTPIYNLVGGPGREFEASGKNWELPGGNNWNKNYTLTGKWRLEISDTVEDNKTVFLHVLQAAVTPDSPQIKKMLRQTSLLDIVDITDEAGNKWELSFNREGNIGLMVKMTDKSGQLKHNYTLGNKIERN